jgi:hypothetical protein
MKRMWSSALLLVTGVRQTTPVLDSIYNMLLNAPFDDFESLN